MERDQVFIGAGAMAQLMRDFDWASTPLGEPATWPASLRTLVQLMLASKEPRALAWGPQHSLIYNDAYAELLDDRHPRSLGCPMPDVWPELWPDVLPNIEQALSGDAVVLPDQKIFMRRKDVEAWAWFTHSYTPAYGDAGRVAGVYFSPTETTREVLSERGKSMALAQLTQLFDQAPGFIAVLRGPDHVFELANQAYARLVGRNEIVGRRVSEVVPEVAAQGYVDLLDRVYTTGQPFIGRRMPVQLLREGEVTPSLSFVDFVFQPIVDADGSVSGIFVQGSDVTDHQRVEDELRARSEEAHQLAEEAEVQRRRLVAVLEAAPVGIAYADLGGRLDVVNGALRRVWGDYPMSQQVDDYVEWKGWFADGGPHDGQPLQARDWPMARALAGEDVHGALVDIEPFGEPGVRRSLLLHSSPVRDADGRITGAITTQQDVSERVRMESELRSSEARFRSITDAMPQIVWSTTPDGLHDFYNQQWYDFTGVPRDSTDGEGWAGMFHPDDQPEAWRRWNHSLSTGEPYEVEYRLRHHSGDFRWVLGRALPVRDDDGRIVRWMGTCTDIHAQKLAQSALEEGEARFRALADNIPQLAWMGDSTGSLFWYNDRWFDYTGTTLDDMKGWGWQSVHHADYVESVTEKFRDHVARGAVWEDSFPLRGKDGTFRWFLSRAVPIRDADGQITRWFGTNTDITEQRDAQDALRLAAQRKDEFLAMLAHELRNPLAPISTAAQLLRLGADDATRVRQASEIISRQVGHMTELVDDLLDVSRVTRGLVQLDLKVIDLGEVITAAVEQVRPLLQSRRHRLELPGDTGVLPVRGDRTRLVQVIANLINNAAKYTPAGGDVEIAVSVVRGQVCVAVRDSGIGIDPLLLPHVFDLFTQGERTPDRSLGGLGIGLSLVRTLAALHGGEVTARSEGVGHGSTFVFSLPLVDAEPTAEPVRMAMHGSTPLDILVVDDNRDAGDTLAELLRAQGHTVRVGADAAEGMALAREHAPQVCILDIGLPDMTGYELVGLLRARLPPLTRFIALTGYGQPQDRSRSRAAGFDHHLVKPVDALQLFGLLARASAPGSTADAADVQNSTT